ncbi:MAG: hypothetical protein KGM15_01525 [Pseudomonadota bacterium]|nr:hypothetical protein [Pseudomonadota bacterium]
MNNSLERLIEGMAATLRAEVIPHIEGDYARGQAFGVIYMLNSLKLRAAWSNAFLLGQLRLLEEASRALGVLAADLPGAPLPEVAAPTSLPDAAELQAARDAGDARMCALIDWLAGRGGEGVAKAQAIVDDYLNKQTKYELTTSARPMFVEMSGGAEHV